MFCRKCGCRVEAYQNFCCYCGAPVNTQPQTQPAANDLPSDIPQPQQSQEAEQPIQPEQTELNYFNTQNTDAQQIAHQAQISISRMSITSFALGIAALVCGYYFGSFILDIILLAVSGFGLIAGIIGIKQKKQLNLAVSGTVFNLMAMLEFSIIILSAFFKNFF